ncbi:MAG: cell division protein ZapB [Deltaproteobacteria bacterium]|nr:cell division protein ZapB [Deltaproteobacteria bacterium]NQT56741.1 cell division protein ZapB [Desulfobacteraceae bacterium]
MNTGEDIDQFQLLEDKIDSLIELITTLRKEKESFAEKIQIQEKKLADLAEKFENLKTARDKAKQRIIFLLEKVEQIDI